MKQSHSRNQIKLSKNNNNTYDIREELTEESFKNELKNKIYSTQRKVIGSNINSTLSDLEEIIRKREKIDSSKKTILDHPFINKTRECSHNIDRNHTNYDKRLNSSSHLKSPFRQNLSHNFNSNYSLKNSMKEDNRDGRPEKNKNTRIYEKEKSLHKKKLINLEQLRNKKCEDELKTLLDKPIISKNSKKIITEMANEYKTPLYQRIQEEQEKKLNSINKLRKLFNEIETEKKQKHEDKLRILTRTDKSLYFNSNNHDYSGNNRFESWRENVMKWHGKKMFKKQKLFEKQQIEIIEYEMNQPYRPHINKTNPNKSNQDMKGSEEKLSIFERLYNLNSEKMFKQEQRIKDSCPNFTPLINKTVPSFLKEIVFDAKTSRNFQTYSIYDKSTNNATFTKSASMTNLLMKTKANNDKKLINFDKSDNRSFDSMDFVGKNNYSSYTIDNILVQKPNITSLIQSMMEEEYNQFDEKKSSLKTREKRTFSSMADNSFNNSSKVILKH